jgi:hypothetical protein
MSTSTGKFRCLRLSGQSSPSLLPKIFVERTLFLVGRIEAVLAATDRANRFGSRRVGLARWQGAQVCALLDEQDPCICRD